MRLLGIALSNNDSICAGSTWGKSSVIARTKFALFLISPTAAPLGNRIPSGAVGLSILLWSSSAKYVALLPRSSCSLTPSCQPFDDERFFGSARKPNPPPISPATPGCTPTRPPTDISACAPLGPSLRMPSWLLTSISPGVIFTPTLCPGFEDKISAAAPARLIALLPAPATVPGDSMKQLLIISSVNWFAAGLPAGQRSLLLSSTQGTRPPRLLSALCLTVSTEFLSFGPRFLKSISDM